VVRDALRPELVCLVPEAVRVLRLQLPVSTVRLLQFKSGEKKPNKQTKKPLQEHDTTPSGT